jgi:hypothetical protein
MLLGWWFMDEFAACLDRDTAKIIAFNVQIIDLTLAAANISPGGSFSVNIIITGTSQ